MYVDLFVDYSSVYSTNIKNVFIFVNRKGRKKEVRAAESKRDFAHKMKISLKELRETKVNLEILQRRSYTSTTQITKAINETDELISIFVASIRTAQGLNKRTVHRS